MYPFYGLSGCKITVNLYGSNPFTGNAFPPSVDFEKTMIGLCPEDMEQIIALYEDFDWDCYQVEEQQV